MNEVGIVDEESGLTNSLVYFLGSIISLALALIPIVFSFSITILLVANPQSWAFLAGWWESSGFEGIKTMVLISGLMLPICWIARFIVNAPKAWKEFKVNLSNNPYK